MNSVFCGGVIISEKWGLTGKSFLSSFQHLFLQRLFDISGAHCFNEAEYSNIKNVAIVVGEHDLSKSNETIYTQSYELKRYILHESYVPEIFVQDYDIAMIETKVSFAFNLAVGPACLPFGYEDK